MLALTLPETLDRRAVAQFLDALISSRGQHLRLDATHTQKVTAVGVELLLATACQWRLDQVEFQVVNWTEHALADLSGLGARPDLFCAEKRS